MSRHFKTRIFRRFECIIGKVIPASEISALHTRGVRYITFVDGIDAYCGMMNTHEEGRRVRKHLIARRYARCRKVFQLYTYHFPKSWSAACVANRELIKEAQRRAHALEHAHTPEALEWRIRFFNHYFKVFKGGAKPAPGMKPYSRFYQYTYVAIYRELQEQPRPALHLDEDVSFEPVAAPVNSSDVCSFQADSIRRSMSSSLSRSLSRSFAHTPLRAAARRAFLSSVDEDFILEPVACFTG